MFVLKIWGSGSQELCVSLLLCFRICRSYFLMELLEANELFSLFFFFFLSFFNGVFPSPGLNFLLNLVERIVTFCCL